MEIININQNYLFCISFINNNRFDGFTNIFLLTYNCVIELQKDEFLSDCCFLLLLYVYKEKN